LIKALPTGPVCHTGTDTCFGESNNNQTDFLYTLEQIIMQRQQQPEAGSYTASLFAKGINKIAQKVGEEAVELIIEAKDDNPDLFLNEAADLMFHLLVLLRAKGISLRELYEILILRHKPSD
jgi:phosphoribosyl-ATP pyrophosphohydrolase/phosphoribosyl-AMP cyclohydrolase